MRRVVLVCVAALASAAAGRGQEPPAVPDPAYHRLSYLVGTWNGVGEQKPSSIGTVNGKFLGTLSCSAFPGGFHVVCNLEGTMGGKPFREMATFGYDGEEKAYTWYDIDNTGMNGLARGSIEKGTWTYLFEMKAGGTPMKMRVTLVEESPSAFLNKSEVSIDGKPWEPVVDARFSRVK